MSDLFEMSGLVFPLDYGFYTSIIIPHFFYGLGDGVTRKKGFINDIDYVVDRGDNIPGWWINIVRTIKDPDILTLLLINGADINGVDSMGNNLLIYLIKNGDFTNLKILLKVGINVNHQNHDGYNAIFFSCVYRNNVIFNTLLKNGGDIYTRRLLCKYNCYKNELGYMTDLIPSETFFKMNDILTDTLPYFRWRVRGCILGGDKIKLGEQMNKICLPVFSNILSFLVF